MVLAYFLKPIHLIRTYKLNYLQPDILAGLTIAFILLPQAIAYASVAELPPERGIYTAVVSGIVAALWGSSIYLQTGPTNPASLLVLSTLMPVAQIGSTEFLVAASLMAFISGVIRLVLGMLKFGSLVYFVADSVIVGFTAGAGMLIVANEFSRLFKLTTEKSSFFFVIIWNNIKALSTIHWQSAAVGFLTIAVILIIKKFRPKWPSAIISLSIATAITYFLKLDQQGVSILGDLPSSLPPFELPPIFDYQWINLLWTGSIAAAAIGLVEAASISRTFAAQSGQRLDTNQEFIGQGLANIFNGLFSGFPSSGSFTRSAITYESGAKTAFASVFASVWVLVSVFLFGQGLHYLPRSAMAGLLIVSAYGMIDKAEIQRTLSGSADDAGILVTTFLATLLLPLQYAVLAGVTISFIRYIQKTSSPGVPSVVPDEDFRHFEFRPNAPECPQLGVLSIQGSLYFGAVHYVEEQIQAHLDAHPNQLYLLMRMHHVNHCDMTGIHMLEAVVKSVRQRGGDVYFMRVHKPVMARMRQTGFDQFMGEDHYLSVENAIRFMFHRILDPALCIYSCPARVWQECQELPKIPNPNFVPLYKVVAPDIQVANLMPKEVWEKMQDQQIMLIDIRELAEWENDGFIANSHNIPLPNFFRQHLTLPPMNQLVFVSRSGRRGRQLVNVLRNQGWQNVYNLKGGLSDWKEAGLPVEFVTLSPDLVADS